MTAKAPLLGNSALSYGAVAKTFHWLTALLIFTAFPLGMIAESWSYDSSSSLATKGVLFSMHKTVGVTVFFVAVLRILWAIVQPKPAGLHPDRKLETWLAETVHWLLYGSLVIVPLSGWLSHASSAGFAPIWWPFGQNLPLVPVSEAVSHFFEGWHFVFTKVLGVAVLLHIAGAIKHQVIDKDLTLARMLPGQILAGTPGEHSRVPVFSAMGVYTAALVLGTFIGLSAEKTAPATELEVTASEWTVKEGDLGISVVQFGSRLPGRFNTWAASIAFDPDAPTDELGRVSVDIAIDSLSLGTVSSEALKPEFFDAAAYPTASFTAPIISDPSTPDHYVADGVLSLKGVEVPVSLPFSLTLDGDTATMEGSMQLDRREFGIGTASYKDEATIGFLVDVAISITATREN